MTPERRRRLVTRTMTFFSDELDISPREGAEVCAIIIGHIAGDPPAGTTRRALLRSLSNLMYETIAIVDMIKSNEGAN